VNALFKDDWLIHDEVADDLIEQVTVGSIHPVAATRSGSWRRRVARWSICGSGRSKHERQPGAVGRGGRAVP
jgi:hypothetical protein